MAQNGRLVRPDWSLLCQWIRALSLICDHELGIVTKTLHLYIQVDTLGLDSLSEVRPWFGALKYAAE